MIDFCVVGDLELVSRDDWNSLVGPAGYYQSYDWLRGQQTSDAAVPTYFLGYEGNIPMCACVVYSFAGIRVLPQPLCDGTNTPWLAGGRTGYHNELLLQPQTTENSKARDTALLSMLEIVGNHAQGQGQDCLVFDYLTTAGARPLVCEFSAAHQLRGVEAVLRDHGRRWDSYLAALSPRRRRNVNREMRIFTDLGFRITTSRLSVVLSEVAPLVVRTLRRYGAAVDVSEVERFLAEQARCADEESVVFQCRDEDGVMVGCSICFRWRDTLYARVAGFDYGGLKGAFEYFNTVFYGPLKYMESAGLLNLHFGTASLDAKLGRGADAEPLWTCRLDLPLTRGSGERVGRHTDAELLAATGAETELAGLSESWTVSG